MEELVEEDNINWVNIRWVNIKIISVIISYQINSIMRKILFSILMVSSLSLFAQSPEDGLRLSWFAPNGTARSNGIAGAMGSLGGDLSASHINPAGLAFYTKGEFSITPKFYGTNNNISFRGTPSSSTDSKSNLGNISVVFADKANSRWTSSAFSISFTQLADYNNHISYSGKNNFSSLSEKYLEELVADQADTNSALNNYIYGSSLAFRTYLVDTMADARGNVIGYQSLVPISTGVMQKYDAYTSGGLNELAFAWAGNVENKLYLGASVTMPMVNYNRTTQYSETDLFGATNTSNSFGAFSLNENFSSRGWGLGAKFGVIYKAEPYLRLGLTIQTPQWMALRDKISADMTTNTEKYAGVQKASSNELNDGYPGLREYSMATPFRTTFSTSYFFAQPNKPSSALGFISADLEWVNYAGTRYYAATYDQESTDYYNALNTTIKSTYRNNVNIKVGGEIRAFGKWLARAGTAYYGSPYKDESLKASKFVISGGLGYRTENHSIDFTISNINTKDALFPYRLNDKPNTYADLNANQLVFSIGYTLRFNTLY
jgi:hypothetical protein